MDYFEIVTQLIDTIRVEEGGTINQVAGLMAECIVRGGVPHVFGSGHSRIPAQEVFIRAGMLSCVRAIAVNEDLDPYERIEGFAAGVLSRYELIPADMLIVFSNSGINPLPIEMAMLGKEKGLKVAAVTSLAHSMSQESRHSSGLRLSDVADITINTHVPPGDAAMQVPGLPMKIGPLSTFAGVMIIDAVVVEAIQILLDRGVEPPVRISRNMPGGDEHNAPFKEKYGNRIPEL